MYDPWGSFQNFMNGFQNFVRNPKEQISRNLDISSDQINDPNAIIQKLMNDGKVSQQQYDAARQAAMRIQNNPFFSKFMKGK